MTLSSFQSLYEPLERICTALGTGGFSVLKQADSNKSEKKVISAGIQEWIGMIGIEKIEGSYYNVMGLPVEKVYRHLKQYIS